MHVKLWVMFIFIFSLSVTAGKYSFVIYPFVVWSHSLCRFQRFSHQVHLLLHFLELSFSIYVIIFLRCLLCACIGNSFPMIPTWALIQLNWIFTLIFLVSASFLLISSLRVEWMLLLLSQSSVICLSLYMVAVLSSVCMFSVYSSVLNFARWSAWFLCFFWLTCILYLQCGHQN